MSTMLIWKYFLMRNRIKYKKYARKDQLPNDLDNLHIFSILSTVYKYLSKIKMLAQKKNNIYNWENH